MNYIFSDWGKRQTIKEHKENLRLPIRVQTYLRPLPGIQTSQIAINSVPEHNLIKPKIISTGKHDIFLVQPKSLNQKAQNHNMSQSHHANNNTKIACTPWLNPKTSPADHTRNMERFPQYASRSSLSEQNNGTRPHSRPY